MSCKLTCPKCGYRSSNAGTWGSALTAGVIAGGLAAGVGFLIGGPIGAAAGGGAVAKWAGNWAQSSVNRACKETGKAIASVCPKCGAKMIEKWD